MKDVVVKSIIVVGAVAGAVAVGFAAKQYFLTGTGIFASQDKPVENEDDALDIVWRQAIRKQEEDTEEDSVEQDDSSDDQAAE